MSYPNQLLVVSSYSNFDGTYSKDSDFETSKTYSSGNKTISWNSFESTWTLSDNKEPPLELDGPDTEENPVGDYSNEEYEATVTAIEEVSVRSGVNCTERDKKPPVTLNLGKMKPSKKLSIYMKRVKRGR